MIKTPHEQKRRDCASMPPSLPKHDKQNTYNAAGHMFYNHSYKYRSFNVTLWESLMRRPMSIQTLISTCLLLLALGMNALQPHSSFAETPASSSASFSTMRAVLHHALNLDIAQALDGIDELEIDGNPTLASQLTRGMIAYFQKRWQTRQASTLPLHGYEDLQAVLETPGKALVDNPQEQLYVGLAAIFAALFQQSDKPMEALQLFNMGQSRLQKALLHDETMTDAHLGLGLMYFSQTPAPSLFQRLLRNVNRPLATDTIHHLQRAAEVGQFSQEVAQSFLLRLYELEKRYKEAVALGQQLQVTFPNNGYYALLTGRSQYANGDFKACAMTLGHLATQLASHDTVLTSSHDRFDLYYFWGLALNETSRYAESFVAFRQAINEDPQGKKDETLWAKYHLAGFYARQGRIKTARQLYHTLLRGRNVDDLHALIQQRLMHLD
jgi:tetratricopeptide (TPR) repeat protein